MDQDFLSSADLVNGLKEMSKFEASLPSAERKSSWSERLKAFAKKDLPKGEDGRHHGEAKRTAKMCDAVIGFAKWSRRHVSDEDSWTDSVLDGGGLRSLREGDDSFPYTLENLALLADESECAQKLYMSRLLSQIGHRLFASGDIAGAVSSVAGAYRLSELPVQWAGPQIPVADAALSGLIADETHSASLRADALLVRAHLHVIQRNLRDALRDLQAAQCLSPDDAELYTAEGNLRNTLNQPREALGALGRAIDLGSTDIEATLFVRGCILGDMGSTDLTARVSARKSLEEYLQQASPDERKVCEAYYHLATLDVMESKLASARRALDRGILAESQRLPCFKANKSNFRIMAEKLLLSINPCGNSECAEVGTMKCECKAIYYCGRSCQKLHWKLHKASCASRSGKSKGARGK